MKKKEILLMLGAPFLGFFAFFVPIKFTGCEEIASGRIVTMVSSIYENVIFLPTAVLLFFIGIFIGYIAPRLWWLLGLFTVIVFPINSIIEMVTVPSSHNLWPIEFAIYSFMALPAMIGSFIGKIKARKT